MTGKPVYKPEEIRFALDLMLQDLFNEEISQAFQERFDRELTDNQIRYLRNKYGKDPDYGSPLINRPANKKVKRRRAALAAGTRLVLQNEHAENPLPPQPVSHCLPRTRLSQIPPLNFDNYNTTPSSNFPNFGASPPSQFSNIRSPSDSYTLSPPQDAFSGPSINTWQTQQRPTFTTSFTPINTQFGQHNASALDQASSIPRNAALSPGSLQYPQSQPLRSASSTQQQALNSFNAPATQHSPSFTLEMPPSNFSQISDVIYNQQPLPLQACQPAQKLEPVKEEDSTSLSWEECLRAAGPAGGRAPSNQLLTHGVEAQNKQLQLNQLQSFPPNTIDTEHEQTVQKQSLVTSMAKQENNAVPGQGYIDPRLFSGSNDPRMFVKKSP
ncbi:hypothetical protein FIE12Z_8629 [Fusarium flagelliforme]|uniref:Clr5 domain-containing protein n=1 Tax=Fusarium flagelliforme TaxID=2675880 RepID=A0A395MGS8_9HYPO|nr:hypothetical protein FIE12Z_8629 [Fusarium flagelliforme]